MEQNTLVSLLTLGLLILPIIWVITDPRTIQEKIKDYFRIKSILFVIGELVFLIGTLTSSRFYSLPKTHFDNLIFGVALFLYFSGISLAIWAKAEMKSKWGLPAEYNVKRQNSIITKGPFALCRNPIYLGLILLSLGYALALRSYTVSLVPLIVIYFHTMILKEEKILTKHFGDEYLEYKSKVPKFF